MMKESFSMIKTWITLKYLIDIGSRQCLVLKDWTEYNCCSWITITDSNGKIQMACQQSSSGSLKKLSNSLNPWFRNLEST